MPRIFCLVLKESHGEAALAPSLPASWRAGLLLRIPSGVLWEPVSRASALGPSAFSEASTLEAQSLLDQDRAVWLWSVWSFGRDGLVYFLSDFEFWMFLFNVMPDLHAWPLLPCTATHVPLYTSGLSINQWDTMFTHTKLGESLANAADAETCSSPQSQHSRASCPARLWVFWHLRGLLQHLQNACSFKGIGLVQVAPGRVVILTIWGCFTSFSQYSSCTCPGISKYFTIVYAVQTPFLRQGLRYPRLASDCPLSLSVEVYKVLGLKPRLCAC